MLLNLHGVQIKVVFTLIYCLIYSKSLGLGVNSSLRTNKTENITGWISLQNALRKTHTQACTHKAGGVQPPHY